jgi:hypothetical protein
MSKLKQTKIPVASFGISLIKGIVHVFAIIISMIGAFYGKYCPRIEWKDEEK